MLWLRQLCAELKIPSLATYGISSNDVAVLCDNAAKASSMKGNPLVLTPDELKQILKRAL